jgi:uroporphyrinogen-III synthase
VRLLLTRTQADARRSAAALRIRGHIVVIAPLFRIETIDAALGTGPWQAILMTSANAASAVAAHAQFETLRALPVFAVGERSAQAVRALDFAEVASAGGNADDLARLVAARLTPGAPLLYLAGEQRSGDLAGDLSIQGFAVHTAVIYRAVAVSALPVAAVDALADGLDGVVHFSRRSAETYVRAADTAGVLAKALAPTHFCLSAQVAEPLARAGARAVRTAPRPAESALFDLIGLESA